MWNRGEKVVTAEVVDNIKERVFPGYEVHMQVSTHSNRDDMRTYKLKPDKDLSMELSVGGSGNHITNQRAIGIWWLLLTFFSDGSLAGAAYLRAGFTPKNSWAAQIELDELLEMEKILSWGGREMGVDRVGWKELGLEYDQTLLYGILKKINKMLFKMWFMLRQKWGKIIAVT